MTIGDKLRAAAAEFDKRPGLAQHFPDIMIMGRTIYDASEFAKAARAFGACEKTVDDFDVRLRKEVCDGLLIELRGSRNYVCKKVKKMQEVEVWECPPSILGMADEPTNEPVLSEVCDGSI